MVYEYENDVISELNSTARAYSANVFFKMSIEVGEVYQKAKLLDDIVTTTKRRLSEQEHKAKAFGEILNIDKNYFKEHGFFPCVEEYVEDLLANDSIL